MSNNIGKALVNMIDRRAGGVRSSKGITQADIEEMVVLNYLLNSRADDGFAYWSNSGFTIDSTNGGSANASFKCVGALGVVNYMLQSIWPSYRPNYTLSAKVSAQNIVLGPTGRVGFEITIYYTDGTNEVKFIPLI
jgi:hypothetical protein